MTFTELLALDSPSRPQAAARPKRARQAASAPGPATATATTPPSYQATAPPAQDAGMPPAGEATGPEGQVTSVAALRQAVRHSGREAATYRLAHEEKALLEEIVYSYHRRGWRSSETEIVRIGLHWLLEEHRARGEASLLHRVLRALNE